MLIQKLLRELQPQPGFVYKSVVMRGPVGVKHLDIDLRPRTNTKPFCGGCGKRGVVHDTAREARRFQFVPLWGLPVYFVYKMRRVKCKRCGPTTEIIPWATGKQQTTHAFMWFAANWAKSLSWAEVARKFGSSWDTVFRCVEFTVRWGLAHRTFDDIRSIGVDELAWKKGHKYLTLVYQIDHGQRRLLHIAKQRTAASFHTFFDMIGPERSQNIQFVASDMWKAFQNVVRSRCGDAVHVLDRFHVAQLLSKAVDQVRRSEARALRVAGHQAFLSNARWLLLKAKKNLSRTQRVRLRDLVAINLKAVRAYLLKEQFQHFWTYTTVRGGRKFLAKWTTMAMRSRLPEFKKLARTLRVHLPELLNWFQARGQFASGATEGFNNKARVVTRKAYGYRTYEHAEIALYHCMGKLPEPPWLGHRFC
jgi:transposase